MWTVTVFELGRPRGSPRSTTPVRVDDLKPDGTLGDVEIGGYVDRYRPRVREGLFPFERFFLRKTPVGWFPPRSRELR